MEQVGFIYYIADKTPLKKIFVKDKKKDKSAAADCMFFRVVNVSKNFIPIGLGAIRIHSYTNRGTFSPWAEPNLNTR